jgi:PAS domain S-box-containing protein
VEIESVNGAVFVVKFTPSNAIKRIPPVTSPTVKPRIFVVEDEYIVARDIQQQLEYLGYDPVGHAALGEEAITLAEELMPDLVLMDIQLAGTMDGIETAQILRTRFSLPIIFLTAFATDEILARAKLTEPYGYIHKPFSELDMRIVLEMALYKKQVDVNLAAALLYNQTILDNMVDGIITIDERGVIDFFNKAACNIFGYEPAEVHGCNVSILMPEPHRSHHDGYLEHYKTTGEARMLGISREVDGLRKDGTVFPMSLSVAKVKLAGTVSFIGTVRDITDSKGIELELRKHREQLEEMVAQQTMELRGSVSAAQIALRDLEQQKFVLDQHAIVSVSDLMGRITYANGRFSEISGYSREELIGQNHSILNSGYHSKEFFKSMYKTISQGKVWQGELRNRSKDGHFYWVDSTIVAFMGENGKPREYIAIRTDITDRKRSEEAASASNHAKSAFLANMSHEIRTPMNGIVGMVDILNMTELRPDQRRMVGIIHNSSLALLNILNDILDYSKVEAGMLAIENIPTNLRKVAESVAQLMYTASTANSIKLYVFVSPELPRQIISDPNRLRQVLINLLGNAIKFTGKQEGRPGQVMLRVDSCTLANGHPGVQFHIIDNGIGISPETLARLFQPFSQSDVSTARKFGGTGLGLSISKRLIELMGGTISVNSSFGEGSRFTVELPLQELTSGCASSPVEQSLAGVHVLAITRDAAIIEILSAYCIAVGAKVTVTADLAAARQQLEQSQHSPVHTVVLLGHDVTTNGEKLGLPAEVSVVRLTQFSSGSRSNEIEIQVYPLLYDDLIHGIGLASGRFVASDITNHIQDKSPKLRKNVPSVEEAVLTGQLILLAEDNEINCEVMQEQLRILGFRAEVARDGLIALEMLRSGRHALLLTDCHMPNMDGFELTAAIRKAEPEGTRLPIIAITANAMKGEFKRCLDGGMDGYLSKPLRLFELERTLAKWLPLAAELTEKTQEESSDKAAELVSNNLASADDTKDAMTGLPAVWDAATLLSLVDGNVDMYHRLLEKFLLNSQKQVFDIRAAMAAGATDVIANVAHNLKSSARTVGAMRLGELCHKLETAGRAGDAHTCATIVECLNELFNDVSERIKKACLA